CVSALQGSVKSLPLKAVVPVKRSRLMNTAPEALKNTSLHLFAPKSDLSTKRRPRRLPDLISACTKLVSEMYSSLDFHVPTTPKMASLLFQPHESNSPGLSIRSCSSSSTGPPSASSTASIGSSAQGSKRSGRSSSGRSQGLTGASGDAL